MYDFTEVLIIPDFQSNGVDSSKMLNTNVDMQINFSR